MTAPDLSPVTLSTLQFDCLFDRRTGFLRQLRVGGIEVLQAIYGVVRDSRWGTVPTTLTDICWSTGEDGFDVSFEADCQDEEGADFQWRGVIQGRGHALEYRFDGRAQTAFRRNRIGLCALHPSAGCAGLPCRVLSPDGTWKDGGFPRHIAPHQPFQNVRALAWSPAPGLDAELRFEGEIFETEDQRNWTDASFKTYGTPLDLPFPVMVAKGEAVRQRIKFECGRAVEFRATTIPCPPEVSFAAGRPTSLPPLGLGMASHGRPLDARQAELLARLDLSHLRVELRFADPQWPRAWERARADAAAIGAGLHCALHGYDVRLAELDRFVELAARGNASVKLCLLFGDDDGTATCAAAMGRLRALHVPIAVGTDANFAELNRARPPAGSLACYSINPQAHAFDDLSLVENIAAQPDTVAAAVAFGARAVAVSPVTLLPRSSVRSRSENRNDPVKRLPPGADHRQRTLFAAAWTLGSLARLAPLSAVQSLTYYETTGWQGVMEGSAGSALPEHFASMPEEVFPVYHLFADLADCRFVRPVRFSDDSRIAALGLLTTGGCSRVMLANLRPEEQTVRLQADADRAGVRLLDDSRLSLAGAQPEIFREQSSDIFHARAGGFEITLPPYAMARIDLPC